VNVEDRLRALGAEIAEMEVEQRIVDEQIAFQTEVAEDARIRALVSETPIADREAQEAAGDLARMQRSRDETRARLDALRAEQDRLLEQMLEDR
jgi:hypothetical protein